MQGHLQMQSRANNKQKGSGHGFFLVSLDLRFHVRKPQTPSNPLDHQQLKVHQEHLRGLKDNQAYNVQNMKDGTSKLLY